MSYRSLVVAIAVLLGATATAQQPAPGGAIPVRRVVLHKTGVGYFEHLGRVRDRQDVTIRNQSALVPIVNTQIKAEKVSLWSQGAGSGRPLRAIWINNTSDLTLDGGSIAVRENMKALRGSSEGRQLLQRYTRQLDDQEDQLEAIRKQLLTLSEQRGRATSCGRRSRSCRSR